MSLMSSHLEGGWRWNVGSEKRRRELLSWSLIDCFTIPLHSPNSRHMPATRAVQWDCHWLLKIGGNSNQSQKPTMLCDWGNPNLYFDQPITKGWCWLTGSHCQSYCHRARTKQQSMNVTWKQFMNVTWRGNPMKVFFASVETASQRPHLQT